MIIGSVIVDPPILLAPMAGITDHVYRLICREMGAGLACTELISCFALSQGNQRTLKMLDWTEEERPVGCQVFGAVPELMGAAAKIIHDRGADLIDINMGCDVRKVIKTGAGAALMKNPDLAASVVRAIAESSSTPVTVKIRGGWGESADPTEVGQALEAAGAAAITIHPRKAGQRFEGAADWSLIRKLKESLRIPVIGCGDVHTPADAERMFAETGCDAVMVGHAALGNPWIFQQMKSYFETGAAGVEPTVEEKLAMTERHVRMLCDLKGERAATVEMRTHIQWYLKGVPGAARIRDAVNTSHTLDAMLHALSAT
ncbi:MAG TPA: tRNA dihydrouridine synthase DusB [Armatimonadota bacterium]|nr:tRNA dihydrouridine synthase DusB [Armatimonadota bacterium]